MMYNALTAAAQDLGGAFSPERLALAGQMTLIGMGMIFAVLSILWAVLAVFKLIFAKPEPKKKAEPAVAAAPAPVEEVVYDQTDDQELIAVITAAVAAYIESENPGAANNGFRVVSFRRANGGKSWNTK